MTARVWNRYVYNSSGFHSMPHHSPLCVPIPPLWKHKLLFTRMVSSTLGQMIKDSCTQKMFLLYLLLTDSMKPWKILLLFPHQLSELCRSNAAFRTKQNQGNPPPVLAGILCPVLSFGTSLGAQYAQYWDNTSTSSTQVDSKCKTDIMYYTQF